MKKVLIVLGLILLGSMLFQKNSNPIPQFTEEQMRIICVQEEI